MCLECKYYQDGKCEFLLLPDSCEEFDLGDKFGQEQDETIVITKAVTQAEKELPTNKSKKAICWKGDILQGPTLRNYHAITVQPCGESPGPWANR